MLAVEGLAYTRDQQTIFGELTFTLNPGGILELKGANGAGKTSLLRILAGLCSASAGSVRCTVSRLYMGHQLGLHPALSPIQNLLWFMQLRGLVNRPAILGVLKDLDLEAQAYTPCQRLSKGQSQRVGLARLRLEDSKLWILDEPCTGLDRQGIQKLLEYARLQLKRGGAIVLASHQDWVIEPFHRQVLRLDRVTGIGTTNA